MEIKEVDPAVLASATSPTAASTGLRQPRPPKGTMELGIEVDAAVPPPLTAAPTSSTSTSSEHRQPPPPTESMEINEAADHLLLGDDAAATGTPKPKPKPKPDHSTPIRVVTAPVQSKEACAAAAINGEKRVFPIQSLVGFPEAERWSRREDKRSTVNVMAELQELSKSISMVGDGFTKLLSGCGITKDDASKKEANADPEKKAVDTDSANEGAKSELTKLGADTDSDRKDKEKDKKQSDKKQERADILLAVPSWFAGASTFLTGMHEVFTGSKDSVLVMGRLVSGVPSLIKAAGQDSAKMIGRLIPAIPYATKTRSDVHPASGNATLIKLGADRPGLCSLLNPQVLARSCNGRILISDGSGVWRTIPGSLSGTRLITTEAELIDAIHQFRAGSESKYLDVDSSVVSLETAHILWLMLSDENLTGLVKQDSDLPHMALQGGALLAEEKQIRALLKLSEKATNELMMSCSVVRNKLESPVGTARRCPSGVKREAGSQ